VTSCLTSAEVDLLYDLLSYRRLYLALLFKVAFGYFVKGPSTFNAKIAHLEYYMKHKLAVFFLECL